MPLILRPYERGDEVAALRAREELAREGFEYLWGFDPRGSWEDFLAILARRAEGRDLPEGSVHSVLLGGFVDGELVGQVSVRFALNEFLAARGGHVGYAVRPAFRRRGHASELLRRGLVLANEHGIDPVLVTCHVNNLGSARVIERAGGAFESIYLDPDDGGFRRYWFHGAR